MLYSIGNIFTREPRQAEHTDTRQAIQRHDPDYERPSQQQNEETAEEFGEDFAHVSVDALSIFLKNFVKEQTSADTQQTAHQQPLTSEPEADTETFTQPDGESNAVSNPAAARAANAYQSMSQAHKQEEVLIETTDAAQGPSLDLSAEDVRSISVLIDDLEELKKARIETLKIERAESFLQSLRNAVTIAKSRL